MTSAVDEIARLRPRADTVANWTAHNPKLALGEQGWVDDAGNAADGKHKIGDGVTLWLDLDFESVSGSVSKADVIATGVLATDLGGASSDALAAETTRAQTAESTLSTALSGKADSADLADVATSGEYSDLAGVPSLATVATSGAYSDLSGKPTVPALSSATPSAGSSAGSAGTATTAAKGDHAHPFPSAANVGAVPASTATTKGDLLVRSSSAVSRLAAGTNGEVLTADSTQTLGVKWASLTATLPTIGSGDAGKVVTVNSAHTGYELDTPAGGGSSIGLSTLAGKGYLVVGQAASTAAGLAPGSDGQVLTTDSTQTDGLKWATPAAPSLSFLTGALSDSPNYSTDTGSPVTSAGVVVGATDEWWTFLDTSNSNSDAKLTPGVWEISASFLPTLGTPTRAVVSSGTAEIAGGIYSADNNSANYGNLHFYVEVTADASIAFQDYTPGAFGATEVIPDMAGAYPAGWDGGSAPAIPSGFAGWTATKIQ